MSTAHLDALNLRLSHERGHLAAAKSDKERAIRTVWIAQVEKEIAGEMKFLGLAAAPVVEMTDDEIMAELLG